MSDLIDYCQGNKLWIERGGGGRICAGGAQRVLSGGFIVGVDARARAMAGIDDVTARGCIAIEWRAIRDARVSSAPSALPRKRTAQPKPHFD